MRVRRITAATLSVTLAGVLAGVLVGVLGVTVAAASPAPPEVTASASVTTAGSIEVAWTAVPGAVGYLVAPQRLTSTGTWALVEGRTQRVTAVRPVLLDGLVNATTYRACVAAVLPDGFTTGLSGSAVPYGLPGAPVIAEVAVEGTQMTVTWTPAAANGRPVTAYTITLSPAVGQEVVVAGNQTSAIIEGLTAGADHTVSVRATNLRGQGDPAQSDTISVPAAPTSGTAQSGAPQIVFTSTGGPCSGAAASTTPPDTSAGSDASSGTAATADPAPATETRTPVVPGAAGPGAAGGTGEDAPGAAGTTVDASPGAPTPATPPELAAPEAAAPEAGVAPPAPTPGREWRWVWVALGVLVVAVIGSVVVQQRFQARAGAGTPTG